MLFLFLFDVWACIQFVSEHILPETHLDRAYHRGTARDGSVDMLSATRGAFIELDAAAELIKHRCASLTKRYTEELR